MKTCFRLSPIALAFNLEMPIVGGSEVTRPPHPSPMQRWPKGAPSRPIDDWAEVHAYRSLRRANEHALVVLAMGLPYWMQPEGNRYRLLVPADERDAVCEQLRKYQHEHRRRPRPAPSSAASVRQAEAFTVAGPLGWVTVLSAAFGLQVALGPAWVEAGALNVERIAREGEFYRVATALLLHGDIGHLAGNAFSGACFGWLAQPVFGRIWAWVWIALAGVLGNAINAAVYYPEQHLSIGASTAVFGALGLLTGAALRRPFQHDRGDAHPANVDATQPHPRSWKARLIPLFAGVALLGWLGGGTGGIPDGSSARTDVLAHLWGFLAGAVLGLFTALRTKSA
ncbi:MAG: rhomboid family intramembrane serine protease [Opitutales bacterium]